MLLVAAGASTGVQSGATPLAAHIRFVECEEVGGAGGLALGDVGVEIIQVIGVKAPEHGDEFVRGAKAGGLRIPIVGPIDVGGFGEGGGEGGGVVDETAFAVTARRGAGGGASGRLGWCWGGGG